MSLVFPTLRTLLRRPGYSLAAVLTLAIGIGASTAIFSVIEGTLLRPLPYDSPEELTRFRDLYLATEGSGAIATSTFVDLDRQARTAELAAYQTAAYNLADAGDPQRIDGLTVSADFFDVLGTEPVLGRGFEEGEDREGREDVVVLTHGLWRERFDGQRSALGREIRLDGIPHTVVGVLPEDFWFPGDPRVVVPFAWTEAHLTAGRDSRWMEGLARLRPGVTETAFERELQGLMAGVLEANPSQNQDWTVQLLPLAGWRTGNTRTSLLLIGAASLLVLLIGCVNVANLMLVRAERRSREMAVRAAMGAGRGGIARQYLGEGLLLSILGGAAGMLVAWSGISLLQALYAGSLPRVDQVGMTLPVLGFGVALAFVTGLVVGLVPAFRLDVGSLVDSLRDGGHGGSERGSRLQGALVVGEVALAVLLVSGAGLLLNSFRHMNRVDTGIEIEDALTFQLQMNASDYRAAETPEVVVDYFDRMIAAIERIPGVEAVGITERTPLRGGYNITTLPSPRDPELAASFVEIRRVSTDYFEAAGIPLLQGRGFTEADAYQDGRAVVVSDELASTIFPEGDALGSRILPGWTSDSLGYEIVGVAESVREFGVTRGERPAVYWPWGARGAAGRMTFVVRTPLATAEVAPAIRRAVAGVDATVPVFQIRTMRDVAIETMGQGFFATTLFGLFGVIALALAALGIFGVLAYTVEQRTREIGIRMALGSSAGNVLRLVMSRGLRLAALGLGIGIVASVYTSDLLADLLFEVEPADPGTLVLVSAVCLATAALASWLPALKAVRVEPMRALRED